MHMKDCVSPEGHLWTDRFPHPQSEFDAVFGRLSLDRYPTARFNGLESTFVRCDRDGCDETGYRIVEVAQSGSPESARG